MKKIDLKATIKEEIKKLLKEADTPQLQPGVYHVLEYDIDDYRPIDEYVIVSQPISEEEARKRLGYDRYFRFEKTEESRLPKIHNL